ncbi:MAG: type I DNA topoisomerase [Deltaproteobacteria bacterium]|nr:MAG: type I DNA topoisomerase [Deltaproteobacteria bacterium]
MTKSLVVVESPAKAKTIEKYLGKGFKVKASVGHIKDLPKSKIGVDIEHDFQPTYQVIEAKKKVIDELRKIADGVDVIYIATDPDREGEAIAWHVADEIVAGHGKGKKKAENRKPVHRVLFNEITKKAVTEAIQNPIELRRNLFDAQQARRVFGSLGGYQVSPLLWDKVRRGLSAGRVQTVALRIICERERAVKAFIPEEYWSLDVLMEGSVPPPFEAHISHFQGKKIKISNADESKNILETLKKEIHTLTKVTKKERRRHPYPPFITSKLQQEASHKLGFSASKTMTLAQKLYEGIELGEEGLVGLITYMRTDSVRVSNDAIAEARDLVLQNWGKEFLPTSPNVFKTKKSAQDAHEAIRPTAASRTPESIKSFLEYDMFRLYELIWKRFIASQMTSAIYDQTSFEITAGDYAYRASGSLIKFSGFLKVYEAPVEEDLKSKKKDSDTGEEDDESAGQMPDLKEGDILKIKDWKPEQHFTEPPPRFSDASLIKELEENGIGRPSTYAAILSNLVDKEYVQKTKGSTNLPI